MLVRPEGRTLRYGWDFKHRSDPVSMLVRPEGRTLHDTEDANDLEACAFVSMLVRPEGRTLPNQRETGLLRKKGHVSMLVRPEGRTLQGYIASEQYDLLFQCSSAPKDGRYHRVPGAVGERSSEFQCSSAPKDGRYSQKNRPLPP